VSESGAPLRIALLLPCFWPEVRRGAERMARELADGLAARGPRPRILTSHPGPSTRSVEDGVEITRLRRPPEGWLRRRGYLEYLTHLPLTYADLRRRDDDVAMALYAADGLAASRWSRRTGRPSVLAYLGVPDRPGLTDRRLRLEVTARAARECTAVTALSRAAADAFGRWLDLTGVEVIPPPVDTRVFTPGGERASVPVVFCPAAVNDPRKRVPVLAGAMERVRRERPAARLVLSGPRSPGIESDAVVWADVDDRSALAEAYRSAWVTALPSFGEAFGLVLVESMACGTPVVGSRHGGIPEIVDDPAIGLTFPLDDEEALAGSLLEAFELASDPNTPAACRARAEEFSAERCAAAYEELYRSLL
jgi:phosphatidyl-myo-inositol alpha-mannosyltransferase